MTQPTALRRLGGFERWCSTRHVLGIYRSVTVAARYRLPSDLADLDSAIVAGLAAVVKDQPMLHIGILKDDTNEPTFAHIPEVDLRNHLEYRDAEAATEDNHNIEAAGISGWLHDQRFPNVDTRPPWRVIVLKAKKGVFSEPCVDIFFAFHHSLMDGTGGKEFHQHLIAALHTTSSAANPITKLSFPAKPPLPESSEESVGFKNSYGFIASVFWKLLRPNFLKPTPAWAGKLISYDHPHVTRVLPIDISAENLQSLLKGAREHSTTLTGLVHALILTSFSSRAPHEASWFECTTPINLRPYMLPTVDQSLKDKLRICVTALATEHPSEVVSDLRSKPSDELVWTSARRIKAHLTQHIAQLPNDDISGLTPLITDMFDFFRKKDGTPRDTLWEQSNLGVLKQPEAAQGEWKVTKASFTNGPMVAGAACGFNAVSVDGLNMSVTWQEGILEEDLMKGVAGDLVFWMKRWHNEGRFF